MALYKERKGGSIYSQGQKGITIKDNGNGGFAIKKPSKAERFTGAAFSIGGSAVRKGVSLGKQLFKETFSTGRAKELYFESKVGLSMPQYTGAGINRTQAPVTRGHIEASQNPSFYNLSLAKSSRLDPFERAYAFNETATVVPNSNNRPRLNPKEMQKVFNF